MKRGDAGLAWVMHTLPHLGWLLAAGEAVHCGGGVAGRSAAAQLQRSALSAVLKVRFGMRCRLWRGARVAAMLWRPPSTSWSETNRPAH